MIEPINRATLIAELEARLASLPTMMELQAWKPRTLDEAIERTRLIGERLATARLLHAQLGRPERSAGGQNA